MARKTIFHIHHIYPGMTEDELQSVVNECSSGDEIRLHGEFREGEIFFKHLPDGLTISGDIKKKDSR